MSVSPIELYLAVAPDEMLTAEQLALRTASPAVREATVATMDAAFAADMREWRRAATEEVEAAGGGKSLAETLADIRKEQGGIL